MGHDVYANERQIISKTSGSTAVALPPDVCFSPPTPPATGVPVPWPNKGSSSDLDNGSTSVFINGKPIMLRDVSFFKVSSGDEGATKGLKKGIVSGQVQGKIYSAFWSMDVFVEGCNVCRHDDPTTHNHG